MTFRFSTFSWYLLVALFAASSFALYLVKYRVEDIHREVSSLQKELANEQESYVLLQAEWSYLNRPDRLRKLADKYLDVKTPNAYHVADVAALGSKLTQLQAVHADKRSPERAIDAASVSLGEH